jgi:preprotein translocase subunit SecD
MRKRRGFFFLIVIVIFISTLLINLSDPIKISFETPKIPFLNRSFSVNHESAGIRPNFSIGPFKIERDLSIRRGLDLQGGTSITLKADMKDIPESSRLEALDSAKSVIEKRINFFGVSEPVVQTSRAEGDYRIIVEIPGVTDTSAAINLIGRTAKLTFWEDVATGSAETKIASESAYPLGITQLFTNPKQTNLTGGDLQQVSVGFNENSGSPQVQLSFTGDGSKKFAEITKRNVGKIVAIVLDDQVIEAPLVNEPIFGGTAVITGNFTVEQARTVQIQLNAGALPVSLSVLRQQVIGATLGKVSLEKSLAAGVIAFIVIVVFMITLYGGLGAIASAALGIYALVVLALFRFIPVTLTLAGIAAMILSIGMAVDANILIFERIKEELRRGRDKEAAIEMGFLHAWPSIRDSNIASLITSAILYYFGTSMVRGFALTLAIGVLVSMLSAIFVTRTILGVFYKK